MYILSVRVHVKINYKSCGNLVTLRAILNRIHDKNMYILSVNVPENQLQVMRKFGNFACNFKSNS